jgi:hypothetical protein
MQEIGGAQEVTSEKALLSRALRLDGSEKGPRNGAAPSLMSVPPRDTLATYLQTIAKHPPSQCQGCGIPFQAAEVRGQG